MAGDYIKCPRCELNYIHKSQGYCDVCKAELKLGPQLVFAVEEDDDEPMELCPICKQVYIREGEEMCAKCREEMDFKKDDIDIDNDEEWKNYLDDDGDEVENDEEMLSLSKLAEEEAGELFDDEEEEEEIEEINEEPDDFEIPEIDEHDFEENDELEEDDEDEEDDF